MQTPRQPSGTLFHLPPLPAPTGGWPLLALLLLFLLPGILSHSPWKIDDATNFGVVWRAAQEGEWLFFHLNGSSLPEPPLFHWLGRLTGALFGGLLPRPDAVRLAALVAVLAAAGALLTAARQLYSRDVAAAAPLALLGSLGFLVQSHETQPMLAVAAGVCALLAGLGSTATPGRAALWIGAGLATVALGDGLALLPAAAGTLLLAQAASDRPRNAWRPLAGGLLLGALLAAPWYLWLATARPDSFAALVGAEWGRLGAVANPLRNGAAYLSLLVWFAWPALPLAAAGLWRQRHAWRSRALWMPLGAWLATLLNLSLVADVRQAPTLLLLPPLALLAAPGVAALRRGSANAFDWFSRLTFSLIVALVWLGWSAIYLGLPPKLSHNFLRLSPGFPTSIEPLAVAAGALVTLLWLWLIIGSPRSPLRSLAHWVAGLATMWVLVVLLWLPWIEHMKSYQLVAQTVRATLPGGGACIASNGLGEPQRAALEYFLGQSLPDLAQRRDDCRYLLVQGRRDEETVLPDEWRKIWEGSRPGDRVERLRLYHRG